MSNPDGHSPQYWKRHSEAQRKAVVAPTPSPQEPEHVEAPKGRMDKWAGFFEHPFCTLALGLVGGIVGVLFYQPVLILSGIFMLAGFYRAQVVRGKSWRIQVPAYSLVAATTFSALFVVHKLVQRKLDEMVKEQSKQIVQSIAPLLPKSLHTHAEFLSLSSLTSNPVWPIREGQVPGFDFHLVNGGDSEIDDTHWGGLVDVYPLDTNEWDASNAKVKEVYETTHMIVSHDYEHDQVYRTISADHSLTAIDVADLTSNPPKKKICAIGKASWRDETGHFETDFDECFMHEDDGSFSLSAPSVNNFERKLPN